MSQLALISNYRQLLRRNSHLKFLLPCCSKQLHVLASNNRKIVPNTRKISDLQLQCYRLLSLSSKKYQQQSDENKNKEQKPDDDEEKKRRLIRSLISATVINIVGATIYFLFLADKRKDVQEGTYEVSWNEFVNDLLAKGEVQELIVHTGAEVVEVILAPGAVLPGQPVYVEQQRRMLRIANVARFEQQLRLAERQLGVTSSNGVKVTYHRPDNASAWIILLAFVGISLYIFYKVRQSPGGMPGFGSMDPFASVRKAQYRLVDRKKASASRTPNIKFNDVAGLHEAKVEVQEFLDYLKRPEAYTKLGAKLPKGALLLGPPGCGKTLLAKALATECDVPFMAINGTDFVEMIGGLGASRVRSLFKEAKEKSPCIIYIDEIDAVGRKRSEGMGGGAGGSGEEDQTLNQLLVELDGMDTNRGVVVLASTNRDDILDKALLRPGRFDRHISIDLPTALERKEIFDLYLSKIKLSEKAQAKNLSSRLSQLTPGFSGADIFNVCNEAAIHAAREEAKQIEIKDFDQALERVVAGPQKRSTTLSSEEKRVVAYHEAGHALLGWMLKHTDALLKVSIIPRTGAALGFSQYSPSDRKLYSKEQLFDRMCMALGGRAAENVKFGRVTSGAEDDLKKVTKLAYNQVRVYGMNDKIGPISFGRPDQQAQGEFMAKPYSKQLHYLIDQEAKKLVADAYFAAEKVLHENVDKLEVLASELLSKEVLNYEDVTKLIGASPHGHKDMVELVDQVLPTVEEGD